MAYFGCGTPSNRIAWCLFTSFTVLWLFLCAFVFIWGWENLFFVFIVSGILFLFSLAPLCYLTLISEPPRIHKGPPPVAREVGPTATGSQSMQIIPKTMEV
mmetsp:Transcript_36523/g.65346  ORF Transcript_36523/g.65346 Transcript_36523/m.65346 type:complete len:101 (+) Transcript_36523:200-502(+)